jgi:hypothetical protein
MSLVLFLSALALAPRPLEAVAHEALAEQEALQAEGEALLLKYEALLAKQASKQGKARPRASRLQAGVAVKNGGPHLC